MIINETELASELAEREIKRQFADDNAPDFPNGLYNLEDEDCTTYTEEAQGIFDELYDEFAEMIVNCQG